MSLAEIERYQRQIALPQFGVAGQARLTKASVLVIGAGGLGCPVLLYLAAAGVGRLGIIDDDKVAEHNLQRQVLFDSHEIGVAKVKAARERLLRLNPHVQIDAYEKRFSTSNALALVRDYDLLIDGTDNFGTKYLINDACVVSDKPWVMGSIFQFEGQVTVCNALLRSGKRGPTYRCLYPERPEDGLVPNCEEAGVLGALAGTIGSIQALEAIKLIAACGEPLSGRLLRLNALSMETAIVSFDRVVTEAPVLRSEEEYQSYATECDVNVRELTPGELKAKLDTSEKMELVDVREDKERAEDHINGIHIPLGKLLERANEIPRDIPVVIYCAVGGRSHRAVEELQDKFGFDNLYNLAGGLIAWREAGN